MDKWAIPHPGIFNMRAEMRMKVGEYYIPPGHKQLVPLNGLRGARP